MGDRVDRQRHRKIYPTMRRTPVWMPEIETLTVTFVSGEYIKESVATKYFYVNSPIVVIGGTDNLNVFISAITIQGAPTSENQYKVTVGRSANIATGVISTIGTITNVAAQTRAAGTYSNVSGTGSGGTGARFHVVVESNAAVLVTVANGGSGFAVGTTITIDGTVIGGNSSADVSFPIATLASQEVHLHISEPTT